MQDILIQLLHSAGALAGWQPLLVIALGLIYGILVGALPGISTSMGVALLVPFTYAMSPEMALVLLGAVYLAANYGGAITAIMINVPGNPSSTVTAFDGYPLARRGEAGVALGIALVGSVVGGLFGILVLIFFAAPLAAFALRMHPAEYCSLALFGLATVASLGSERRSRAFASALLGLLIATVGLDPISGVDRFTFGSTALFDGFPLIPALVGLFALAELFEQLDAGEHREAIRMERASAWPSWLEYWRLRGVMLRSSIIGTIVGVLPGAGATIAAFMAYDVEKRLSKHPEEFGKGSHVGVAAGETADSASVGGALIPLLTLGLPGSPTTAVMVGAFMIHDLTPGPRLFELHADLVYLLFGSLLLGNLMMLAIGMLGNRLWMAVAKVSKPLLYPLIIATCLVGSFSVRNSLFDVWSSLLFGVIGWVLRRFGFPVAPIVLGMVLGSMIEVNLRRAVMMGGWMELVHRPISATLLVMAAASFVLPLVWPRKSRPAV